MISSSRDGATGGGGQVGGGDSGGGSKPKYSWDEFWQYIYRIKMSAFSGVKVGKNK